MKQNISLMDYIVEHCSKSMNRAVSAERFPLWKRSCPEFSDLDFTYLGLLRCIIPLIVVDIFYRYLRTFMVNFVPILLILNH